MIVYRLSYQTGWQQHLPSASCEQFGIKRAQTLLLCRHWQGVWVVALQDMLDNASIPTPSESFKNNCDAREVGSPFWLQSCTEISAKQVSSTSVS